MSRVQIMQMALIGPGRSSKFMVNPLKMSAAVFWGFTEIHAIKNGVLVTNTPF